MGLVDSKLVLVINTYDNLIDLKVITYYYLRPQSIDSTSFS